MRGMIPSKRPVQPISTCLRFFLFWAPEEMLRKTDQVARRPVLKFSLRQR
jgi:hypothetical protein